MESKSTFTGGDLIRLAAVVLVGSTLAVGATLWRWAEGHIVTRLVRR